MMRLERMTSEEREAYYVSEQKARVDAVWGAVNEALVCPHCQVKGRVHSMAATRTSTAVSNTIARVSASTTTSVTQRHCENCNTTWDV